MSEIFRIGIELALIDAGFKAAMGQVLASLAQVRQHTDQITAAFNSWKSHPALVGAASLFGGYELAKGIAGVGEASKAMLDAEVKLKNAGVATNDVLRIRKEYYENINKLVPTARPEDWIKTVGEIRSITGAGPEGVSAAMAQAPKALMVDALLENLKNAPGTKLADVKSGGASPYYELLRSAELKGIATNPEELEKLTDRMVSILMAFQGKLSVADVKMMAKRGGTAWIHAKPEAIGPMSVLASDLGGSGAGTNLFAVEQMMKGVNKLSQVQVETMVNAGLLDPDKLKAAPFGMKQPGLGAIKGMPGWKEGGPDYLGDIPGWLEKIVAPGVRDLAKREKAKDPALANASEDSIFETLMGKIFRQGAQQRLSSMYSHPGFLDQIKKDLGIADVVKSIPDAYSNFIHNDPVGVEAALAAQKSGAGAAIGAPVMDNIVIPVMEALTKLFTAIGQLAEGHPKIIEGVAIGLAALAAAMVVGGMAALIIAIGPTGWLVAGLTALVGAVAGFVAANWDSLKAAIQSVADLDVKAIGGKIASFGADLAKGITDALAHVVTQVNDWIKRQFNFTGPTPAPGGTAPGAPAPGGATPQSNSGGGWEPGGKAPKVVQIAHTATLDGEVLARSIAQYLVAEMEHPRQSGHFDGREGFTSPDHQPLVTT